MAVIIQREATEYLYIGITGDLPATDQEVAFLAAGVRPTEPDWNTAILVNDDTHVLWADASAVATGDYFLAILIGSFGSTGVVLPFADYTIWVRLTDTTEQPVRIVPEALEVQ